MEIKKHTLRFKNTAIKLSEIVRVLWDVDDTVKFSLRQGVETGWVKCTRAQYESIVDAWENFLESSEATGGVKRV